MQVSLLTLAPLLPALPAVALVVEAFRARTARGARAIIVLGALTIVTGAAIFAGCVALTFSTVADARPEDKAVLMVRGFARGQSAVSLGIVVGAGLCVLGGIARSLYRPRVGPQRPGR
ncbi:MAG TPA: hypothetical protein VHU40_20205 [Polyangia bacterium]|nr:hypothetical protein [Polyangia bacterium]